MTDDLSSWAIKYRPRDVEHLIASDSIKQRIADRIRLRDEHAILLTGPTGCGKTSIAAMLAYGYARVPYGTANPDIVEINVGDKKTIDDMRAAVETSRYLPSTRDGRRVLQLEEVHSLTKISATPLLRALEKSPKTTLWLLVTNEPHRLLPTLVDRCYPIRLDLAPVEAIKALLARVLRKERVLQDWRSRDRDKLLEYVVRASGQIPRAALQILKAATDAAPNYRSVRALLAAPELGSPQAEIDAAALKIILALLLSAHRRKSLAGPIFRAVVNQDAYGLLKRMLSLANSAFLEAATTQQQPGTYQFNAQLSEVESLRQLDAGLKIEVLGNIVDELAQVQATMTDFAVDPMPLLNGALWRLLKRTSQIRRN